MSEPAKKRHCQHPLCRKVTHNHTVCNNVANSGTNYCPEHDEKAQEIKTLLRKYLPGVIVEHVIGPYMSHPCVSELFTLKHYVQDIHAECAIRFVFTESGSHKPIQFNTGCIFETVFEWVVDQNIENVRIVCEIAIRVSALEHLRFRPPFCFCRPHKITEQYENPSWYIFIQNYIQKYSIDGCERALFRVKPYITHDRDPMTSRIIFWVELKCRTTPIEDWRREKLINNPEPEWCRGYLDPILV
jgi:hypothetical protein